MKRRDLEKHLRSCGCRLHHHGGSHDVWLNPATGDMTTVPRHRDIRKPTVKSICRTLKVPEPQL